MPHCADPSQDPRTCLTVEKLRYAFAALLYIAITRNTDLTEAKHLDLQVGPNVTTKVDQLTGTITSELQLLNKNIVTGDIQMFCSAIASATTTRDSNVPISYFADMLQKNTSVSSAWQTKQHPNLAELKTVFTL